MRARSRRRHDGHGFGRRRSAIIRKVAVDVDFWSFAGLAGNQVVIQGPRLDAGLDPVLDLYFRDHDRRRLAL
jgi:hypothetical protein